MILADLREAMDTSSDPEEVVGWVYLGYVYFPGASMLPGRRVRRKGRRKG